MDPSIISELFKSAILLPIVVGVAYFALIQHRAIREAERARAEDGKAIVGKLIELSDKWNLTISQQLNVNAASTEALRELRQSLNELRSAVDRGYKQ